eukprot:1901829-Amphidinium_carterae.4
MLQVWPSYMRFVALTLSFDDTGANHTQRTVDQLPTSIVVMLADNTTDRLCSAKMSDGSTHWQLHWHTRLIAQSALGTGHALRKWLVKHRSHLTQEGIIEVESVLALLQLDEGPTPFPMSGL